MFPALSSRKQGPGSVRSQRMCPLKEAMPEPGGKPGQHPQRGQMSAESEAMEWTHEIGQKASQKEASAGCGALLVGRWGTGAAVRSQRKVPQVHLC